MATRSNPHPGPGDEPDPGPDAPTTGRARDESGLRDYAERTAGILTAAGFPRMPARVLMALMVAKTDGLTAAELADALGVSAAGVSGAVQYLTTVAMIHRVPQPGTRRAVYRLPDDSWYAATMNSNPTYEMISTLSRAALESTGGPDDPASVRISEWMDLLDFLRRRMPELLIEWKAGRP